MSLHDGKVIPLSSVLNAKHVHRDYISRRRHFAGVYYTSFGNLKKSMWTSETKERYNNNIR